MQGSQGALLRFNADYCSECGVGGRERGFYLVDEKLPEVLAMGCEVDSRIQNQRLCAVDGASRRGYRVPDENWFEVDHEIFQQIESAARAVTPKLNMVYDPNRDVVFVHETKKVHVFGNSAKVEQHWRDNCSACEANPDKEATLDNFNPRKNMHFVCKPEGGLRRCQGK